MKMDTAISVKNVSKKFKLYKSSKDRLKEAFHPRRKKYHQDFWALQDISFDVSRGTTMGIIGQNGCGKSTLLQIICGILRASSGHVKTNGRISALLELGAGFNPDFTGRQNVYMSGAVKGFTKKDMDERFDDIVSFADIGDFIEQPVKTYSSGMYVRLAFACAVNVDPDILVIDEALAVGDDMFKRRCYRKLEDFKKQDKTILFVSHSPATITSMCDCVVLLDKGKIVQIGNSRNVVKTYSKMLAAREETYVKKLKGNDNQKSVKQEDERLQKPVDASDSECRYGTGEVAIRKFEIFNEDGDPVTVIETGKRYIFKTTVLFKKNVMEPAIGISILTLTGIEIFGTSTEVSSYSMGPVKANTLIVAEFDQVITLNPGSYAVNVSVAEFVSHQRVFLDRRLDMLTFKVIGNAESYGLVNMNVKISISSLQNTGG